jgi:PAS domain S-box-containing protein
MRVFARTAGAAVVAQGCLVLAGWSFDSPALMSVFPGLVAMNPATATAFILAGSSLWLLSSTEPAGSAHAVGRACAFIVGLIALTKLVSFLGPDPGIDRLLFREKLDALSPPNRMAPNTTLNFLLTGVALLALDVETRGRGRPAQVLAVLSALTSLFALIGYAFEVQYLYGLASYIPMALNTALAFAVLSVGILCARPDQGLMAVVTSGSPGGVTARRLLPAALGLPVLLGWLCLAGQRAGLYDTSFGVALLVLLIVIAFAVLIGWTASSLDLADAERRRAETALERLRRQLQLILDSAGEGIQGLDRQGRITLMNPAAARLLGRDGEDPIGLALHDVVHGSGGDAATHLPDACPVSAASRDGAVHQRSEDVFWRADGTSFPVEYVSTPIRERGEVVGAVVAFLDITERREVERVKEEFVSLVSHELRTPLTSIHGYVELLLEGAAGALAEEQQEFLTVVRRNTDRLLGLVNELLDLSRIEAGRMELQPAVLDLVPAIRRVADSLRPSIEKKGQHLSIDVADGLPPIWADADRVTQILTNLLSNAHKYTPAGGRISVAARRQDGRVRVEVRDTGIGLTADEQAQLFTKFFRSRNRAAQAVGGTGLGLAITRSLVELHGGEIGVVSAPGRGSTFSFTVPVHQAPPTVPEAVGGMDPARPSRRVLVVDDEPDVADLIRHNLERGGYDVLVARSGAEALRLAQDARPDLITLDIALPDVDGFTVLEQLKDTVSTATIPVLLLSILTEQGRGKLLGAVDYLRKPVPERVLLERVARILADDRSRRVLVADDDDDARALLAGHLRRAGYLVVEAANGADAVALARRELPGLALIDVRMPGTDGLAALRALRAEPATSGLAVIMMTASPLVFEESRSAVEALGGTALLTKPCTPDELAAVLMRPLVGQDSAGRTRSG